MFPATLFTAGMLGILLFILSYRVVQMRVSGKILIGDGGNEAMLYRQRAHANFTEYVPLVLILMGLIEASFAGDTPLAVWAAGIIFVIARVLHAWGMTIAAPNKARVFGTVLTAGTVIVLSVWALVIGIGLAVAQP